MALHYYIQVAYEKRDNLSEISAIHRRKLDKHAPVGH